jgi:hypothetical protein
MEAPHREPFGLYTLSKMKVDPLLLLQPPKSLYHFRSAYLLLMILLFLVQFLLQYLQGHFACSPEQPEVLTCFLAFKQLRILVLFPSLHLSCKLMQRGWTRRVYLPNNETHSLKLYWPEPLQFEIYGLRLGNTLLIFCIYLKQKSHYLLLVLY